MKKKIAIIYKSLTGNTKLLAEAVRAELKDEEIVCFGEPQESVEADLYIVGSWTDKGVCDEKIAGFLQTLRNKEIAYFGTAGFGGSEEYYERIYSRVRALMDESNTAAGYFMCQGRMPESVRSRYEKLLKEQPDDPKILGSLDNFDRALSHPDESDLAAVRAWAREII